MKMNQFISKSIKGGALCAALLTTLGTGCQRPQADSADNGAMGESSSLPASSASNTKITSKAPVTLNGKTASKAAGKASAPAPVKMTGSQKKGIDILTALNAAAVMRNHKISVGTSNDTVMLNGKVQSAVQKKTAEAIARQNAKGFKIVNQIEVVAK